MEGNQLRRIKEVYSLQITIVLTPEQHKNLMVFLNRVEVKGLNEAAALIDLARAINTQEVKTCQTNTVT